MNHPTNPANHRARQNRPLQLVCHWLRVAFKPEIQFVRAGSPGRLAVHPLRDGGRRLDFPRRHSLNPAAVVATNPARHASPPR